MIPFSRLRLDNGLTLLHHFDTATRMVAVNLLYRVGSADETPPQTGLAHLCEHLMFSGSRHVGNFDEELQAAGGESNAWTSVDATNYYAVLPAQNLNTALWLESDRLMGLTLENESIVVQKGVVIEEFKQRVLNQPYGDMSHIMGRLAYTTHPYQWPAIGRSVEDIEALTETDVRSFHAAHYAVNNLTLCISGNVTLDHAVRATRHWFDDIAPRQLTVGKRPGEPAQRQRRTARVMRNVPQSVICWAYHMAGRRSGQFRCLDILSDILASGKSARFYRNLLQPTGMFAQVDASVTGTIDNGLFMVRATLAADADHELARLAVERELDNLVKQPVTDYELKKFVNKHISSSRFESVGYLQQAMRLCQCEQLGDADLINTEEAEYLKLTTDDIMRSAETLTPDNCSTLFYLAGQ